MLIQSRSVVPGHSSMEMYRVYGQRAAAARARRGSTPRSSRVSLGRRCNSRGAFHGCRPRRRRDPVSSTRTPRSSDVDDPESSSSSSSPLTSANNSEGRRTRPARLLPGALESVSAPDAGAASRHGREFRPPRLDPGGVVLHHPGSSISASARASLSSSSCRLSMASFFAHGSAALLKWIFFTASGSIVVANRSDHAAEPAFDPAS